MSDTTLDDFDFSASQGAEHAEKSAERSDYAREIEYLKLDATPAGKMQGKDSITLRFVTDSARRDTGAASSRYNLAWITVAGHFSNTKPKPDYFTGTNWPSRMGAGCRKDPIFAKRYGGQCLLCDQGSKPSNRYWALAVERTEVRGPAGDVIGWADVTREVFDHDEDGKSIVVGEENGKKVYQMKTSPAWVLCQMGWRNFFQPLSGQTAYHTGAAESALRAIGMRGGSGLLNNDVMVTRTGTDNNDTSYTPVLVSSMKIPAENPWGVPEMPYDLSAVLPDGSSLMEKVYPDMPDLRRIISEKVSDDFVGYWFEPGWAPKDFDPSKAKGSGQAKQIGFVMGAGGGQAAPSTPATQPTEEPTSDALARLKARVNG